MSNSISAIVAIAPFVTVKNYEKLLKKFSLQTVPRLARYGVGLQLVRNEVSNGSFCAIPTKSHKSGKVRFLAFNCRVKAVFLLVANT